MNCAEPHGNLHIMLLLRLMEVPLTDLNAVIQGYKQICEIEETHATNMISLARQQHSADDASPPSKRPFHAPPAMPHASECPDEKASTQSILDRGSNATYHGMSNLTARIFHEVVSRGGESQMECHDVAQGVLEWLQKTDHVHKKTKFVVRPCNRRTGSLCMVYTRLPPGDPVHSTITDWILLHKARPAPKPGPPVSTSGPDVLAFDPWMVWGRFQKAFPVMAIYKSQCVSTSDIAHATSFPPTTALVSPEQVHASFRWPHEIDVHCVIKLASRLYNDQPWARWLIPVDQDATHCHTDSIGCLRRAACVLHGFLLGPKGSCANIWEAIIMLNRSSVMCNVQCSNTTTTHPVG